MKKKLLVLISMLFLIICFTIQAKDKSTENFIEVDSPSITDTVKPESKFFEILEFTNTSQDKKLKFWIESKLYYVDDSGNKQEIELKKQTSWKLSPVIGIGIGIGSGGSRVGSGVGVEVSPDSGTSGKYVIDIVSGVDFKPGEVKNITVNFDFSNLRIKKNKNVKITNGKIIGEITLEERSKNNADIVIPIEINIKE